MSRLATTFLFCLFINFLSAQKMLSHSDYDQWNSISKTLISIEGDFVAYSVEPQKGDGLMILHSIENGRIDTFDRAQAVVFSGDQHYLLAKILPTSEELYLAKKDGKKKDELPKDSLLVIHLESLNKTKFPNVTNMKYSEDFQRWLAFESSVLNEGDSTARKEKNRKALFLFNLDDLVIDTIWNPKEYSFNKTESHFVCITEAEKGDSSSFAGLYLKDLSSGSLELIDSSAASYAAAGLSAKGGFLSYFGCVDSFKNESPRYFFKLYNTRKKSREIKVDSLNVGDERLFPSPDYKPQYPAVGNHLILGFKESPLWMEYEADTSILDEERVSVDIWSWNDIDLQPRQSKQLPSVKKRTLKYSLNLKNLELTQITKDLNDNLLFDPDTKSKYALLYRDTGYRMLQTWSSPWLSDLYAVNVSTGEEVILADSTAYQRGLSPDGSFAQWFNHRSGQWHVYDLKRRRSTTISHPEGKSWTDELNDRPMAATPYGAAGWTKKSKALWIYDRYDIWAYYPATGITQRLSDGRDSRMIYRYRSAHSDEEYILDQYPATIMVINEATKSEALLEWTASSGQDTIVRFGPYGISGISRAEKAERLLIRKGSFRDYPDLYLSTEKGPARLSEANPQQQEYLWGNVRLMPYKSLSGKELESLLYVPDEVDPSEPLPVLVYFYERSSNRMHRHRTPAPSASTINIPYCLSNGYVVLVPDIVYEEGNPGESAFDCVMGAVQELCKLNMVDSTRIGIQGQSWGGYQVAYLITRTDKFKAAMAGAPVSNMTSAYGGIRWGSGLSRMFQYEQTQSRLGADLWEDRDAYIRNSPLFFADKVQTPLLIMHNDADGAVPWYQGIEYFNALRRLRKPVWMLVYNGEAHNIVKRHNRKDLSVRMMQFFDHYLKGYPAPSWMKEGIPALHKGRTLGYE